MTRFPITAAAWARLKMAWREYRIARASSRLAKLLDKRLRSFEHQQFLRRRDAALRGHGR